MTRSVGVKAQKKQTQITKASLSPPSPQLEQALLSLESVCARVLENQLAPPDDVDGMLWQQRFKNVVLPVSLALAECKGPRYFHQHYRHKESDSEELYPVLEDPIDQLAQVCERALVACQNDLVGVYGEKFLKARRMIDFSLRNFLIRNKKYKTASD